MFCPQSYDRNLEKQKLKKKDSDFDRNDDSDPNRKSNPDSRS